MLCHNKHYKCATVMQMEKVQNGAILDLIALHGSKSPVGRILADVSLIEETGCWSLCAGSPLIGTGRSISAGKSSRRHRVIYSSLVGKYPTALLSGTSATTASATTRRTWRPARIRTTPATWLNEIGSAKARRTRPQNSATPMRWRLCAWLKGEPRTKRLPEDRYGISRGYVSEVARGLKRKHLRAAADYSPTANKHQGIIKQFRKDQRGVGAGDQECWRTAPSRKKSPRNSGSTKRWSARSSSKRYGHILSNPLLAEIDRNSTFDRGSAIVTSRLPLQLVVVPV